MALAESGRHAEAIAALSDGRMSGLGAQTSFVFREWIAHNQALATSAGDDVVGSLRGARRRFQLALALALLLSGGLAFLTFRSIVGPVRGLRGSVESIAGGNFGVAVPFTEARDETGSLARSIDVLRRGAAAMEDQRWVKTNVATITGDAAGSGHPRRVRRAAAVGAGAGARRRRGGLLRPGARGDAPAADRPLRPGGVRPGPGVDRSRRGAPRPVRARGQAGAPGRPAAGLPACHLGPGRGGARRRPRPGRWRPARRSWR